MNTFGGVFKKRRNSIQAVVPRSYPERGSGVVASHKEGAPSLEEMEFAWKRKFPNRTIDQVTDEYSTKKYDEFGKRSLLEISRDDTSVLHFLYSGKNIYRDSSESHNWLTNDSRESRLFRRSDGAAIGADSFSKYFDTAILHVNTPDTECGAVVSRMIKTAMQSRFDWLPQHRRGYRVNRCGGWYRNHVGESYVIVCVSKPEFHRKIANGGIIFAPFGMSPNNPSSRLGPVTSAPTQALVEETESFVLGGSAGAKHRVSHVKTEDASLRCCGGAKPISPLKGCPLNRSFVRSPRILMATVPT